MLKKLIVYCREQQFKLIKCRVSEIVHWHKEYSLGRLVFDYEIVNNINASSIICIWSLDQLISGKY